MARGAAAAGGLNPGEYMKIMKPVKLMKGGWHAMLTWRPPAAAHRSVGGSDRQDLTSF
jgi:hypothetical protein